MKPQKTLLTVWASSKKEEMYIYTNRLEGLKRVPEELLKMFGAPKEVMGLPLSEDKKLGRADVRDDYMLDLYKDTSAKYTDII